VIDPCVSLYFKAENVWTYFADLHRDQLPSAEELFKAALSLYDNYSTPRAGAIFMTEFQPNSSIVSTGEPWMEEEDAEPKPDLVGDDDIDAEQGEGEDRLGRDKGKGGPKKQRGTVAVEGREFNGDRTLARSALFMYEALVSKEVAQAVAEGDIGRVYEGIKVGH
jgi:hypothetical protein